jgi:hypothetical protein
MAARYGRNQKQNHLSLIERQKRAIEARDGTVKRLKGKLVESYTGLRALIKNTPDTEWAIILGGIDDPEAKKLLVSLKKTNNPPIDPVERAAWNRAMRAPMWMIK